MLKINCTICNNNNTIFLLKCLDRDHNLVELLKCLKCNHKFQKNYSIVYDSDDYNYYKNLANKKKAAIYDCENTNRYKEIFKIFNKYVIKNNLRKDILDIGCGHGEIVNYANNNGWNCQGIELSEEAVKIATVHNVNVKNIDLDSSFFKNKKYSIVILTEVIEHVLDLKKLLNQIKKILEENGIVYITTPNFNSLDRYFLKNQWPVIHKEHVNYFDVKTLKYLIYQFQNFELIKSKTANIILSLYIIRFKEIFFNNYKKKNILEGSLDSQIRSKINNNIILFFLKNIINFFLNIFSLGNNITFIIRLKNKKK